MTIEKQAEETHWMMRSIASLSGYFFPKPEVVIGRLKRWGYEIVSEQVDGDIITIGFKEGEQLRNTPIGERKQRWLGLDDRDYPDKASRDVADRTYSASEPKPRFKPGCEFVDKSSFYRGKDGGEYATFEHLREADRRWAESQRLPDRKPEDDLKINLKPIEYKSNLDYIKPKPFEQDRHLLKDDWKYFGRGQ